MSAKPRPAVPPAAAPKPPRAPSAPTKLKVVCRSLPPHLPEPLFWQTVSPWVSDDTAGWRSFVKGKLAKASVALSYQSLASLGVES